MDVSDDADRLQTLLYSSYSADVVRQLERPLLDDGVPLMRMAASAVARVTLSLLDDEDLDVEDARVTVLAGAGDNGGDGLYAGAELAREGAQVTAVAVGRSLHEDAFRAFVRAGGRVLVLDPAADISGCTSGFSAGEAGERLQAAVKYGADAVYLGATSFGMRANAGNFNEEELRAGVKFAHEHGVRVYLTCNILPTNEEADQLDRKSVV